MRGRESSSRAAAGEMGAPARGAARAVLLLATFASGFAVTGIEIALGRLLAPHFGASLTVWAAIIAAVVAALAVGYPLGGALADRRPGAPLPLAALALGGALGCALGLLAPFWLRTAMQGVGLAGSRYWLRLFGALLAFAVPCVLLAGVPPAALRATLRERSTAGRDAGLLYALGSAGSVLGVLLPALWWIPLLGLRSTFLLIGALACAPALLGVLCGMLPWRRPLRAAAVLLVLGILLLPASVQAPRRAGHVLYEADSALQRIRVIERDTPTHRRRWLQLNEGWSSHSAYLEPSLVTHDVWDWMALTALLPRQEGDRLDVLIIGLAGGTVSNLMTRWLAPLLPGLAITGVELDPQVIEVADRYLGLDRRMLRTVTGDGRVWLRGSTERFDLILLDAYQQPSIPAHLATAEFFEEVRAHLTPGGIAVLNAFAPARPSALLDGLTATWLRAFPYAQRFAGPPADGFASYLLLGEAGAPVDFARVATARVPAPLRSGWELLQRRTRPLDPSSARVRPWSDDRSPVELLTDRAFRALRPATPAPQPG
jgi:spermidine synthase